MDHMRAVLVLLVVFGHFLEVPPADRSGLYRALYAFHIPALMFLSGRFARVSRRRVVRLCLLYTGCQILYRLFDWLVLGNPQKPAGWLLVPYWHLWYLAVLIACLALLPLLVRIPQRYRPLAFAVSLCAAVFWGLLPVSGYWLSFGRFLSFFPFFLSGVYLKDVPPPAGKRRLAALFLLAALCAAGTFLLLRWDALPTGLLYGAENNLRLGATVWQKAYVLALAFAWVFLLFLLPWPSRPLPLWTHVGKNTLPVYLLHGFFVAAAKRWTLFSRLGVGTLWPSLILSLLLTLLLANPALCGAARVLLNGRAKETALFSPKSENND